MRGSRQARDLMIHPPRRCRLSLARIAVGFAAVRVTLWAFEFRKSTADRLAKSGGGTGKSRKGEILDLRETNASSSVASLPAERRDRLYYLADTRSRSDACW